MHELTRLMRTLIEAEVEFVLVGGLAAVTHGSSLHTSDIDVCCRFTPENLLRLQEALRPLNPRHRMTPAKLPLELDEQGCRGLRNLYLVTELGVIDCLGEVAGLGDFDKVLADSMMVETAAGRFRVLTIDALIRAKEAMNRPHDRETVSLLRAIKERGA